MYIYIYRASRGSFRPETFGILRSRCRTLRMHMLEDPESWRVLRSWICFPAYPLVMTHIAHWKITMLFMGKITIDCHFL